MVLAKRLAQDARHGAIPRRSELQREHEEARAVAALVSVRELCRGTPLLGSTQLLSGLWPLPLCGRDQTGSAHWTGLARLRIPAPLVAWKAAPPPGRETARRMAEPDQPCAVPPRELMTRVGQVPDTDAEFAYVVIGEVPKSTVIELLGPEWNWDGRRVLDFGCSSGRLLGQFLDEARSAESTALTSTRRRSPGHRSTTAPRSPMSGSTERNLARLSRRPLRPCDGALGLHRYRRRRERLDCWRSAERSPKGC